MCAHWSNRMVEIARELNDPDLLTYGLAVQTRHAIDSLDPKRAVDLSTAALNDGPRLTGPIRGLGMITRAWAFASAGSLGGSNRSIDRAMDEALRNSDDPFDVRRYFDQSMVEIEAAGCWVLLGRPYKAIDLFERRSANWPRQYKRNQGLILSRLANACAAVGNLERACDLGLGAVEIAHHTWSAYTVRGLLRLVSGLAPVKDRGFVEHFMAAVDDLTRIQGYPQAYG